MAQVMTRVEEGVPVAAQVAGRAHAVEEERERLSFDTRVEPVARRVNLDVRRPARVQLRKERAKPIRVFVVDGYRRQGFGHAWAPSVNKKPPPRAAGATR